MFDDLLPSDLPLDYWAVELSSNRGIPVENEHMARRIFREATTLMQNNRPWAEVTFKSLYGTVHTYQARHIVGYYENFHATRVRNEQHARATRDAILNEVGPDDDDSDDDWRR